MSSCLFLPADPANPICFPYRSEQDPLNSCRPGDVLDELPSGTRNNLLVLGQQRGKGNKHQSTKVWVDESEKEIIADENKEKDESGKVIRYKEFDEDVSSVIARILAEMEVEHLLKWTEGGRKFKYLGSLDQQSLDRLKSEGNGDNIIHPEAYKIMKDRFTSCRSKLNAKLDEKNNKKSPLQKLRGYTPEWIRNKWPLDWSGRRHNIDDGSGDDDDDDDDDDNNNDGNDDTSSWGGGGRGSYPGDDESPQSLNSPNNVPFTPKRTPVSGGNIAHTIRSATHGVRSIPKHFKIPKLNRKLVNEMLEDDLEQADEESSSANMNSQQKEEESTKEPCNKGSNFHDSSLDRGSPDRTLGVSIDPVGFGSLIMPRKYHKNLTNTSYWPRAN